MALPIELVRLAAVERAAEDALHQARNDLDAALKVARETTGMSYAQLATATGLTPEGVRSRVMQPHIAAKAARHAALQRLLELQPSVSATEAARRLETSRTQVAVMVADGRLHEVSYRGRARKRIALDAAWHAAVETRGLQDDAGDA